MLVARRRQDGHVVTLTGNYLYNMNIVVVLLVSWWSGPGQDGTSATTGFTVYSDSTQYSDTVSSP